MKLGISTVCMLMNKVRNQRGQDQYYSNIALKVNTKLGGVNHRIDGDRLRWLKDAMLVGMDVSSTIILNSLNFDPCFRLLILDMVQSRTRRPSPL